jgi:hypothetical protein
VAVIRIRIPIWSRLTRVQRILLASVAVIVLLFVTALAIGGSQDEGDAAKPPGFVTWLGGQFAAPTAVDPADLSGACLPALGLPEDHVLNIDANCDLRVAAHKGDLRELRLRAHGNVSVEAPLPRGDGSATKELDDGDELKVSVNADGADIMLTCSGSDKCAVGVG